MDDTMTLRVRQFVDEYRDRTIESTGASLVSCDVALYNVAGSTRDPKRVPKHENEAWLQLLISYGIDPGSNCYVTNPGAGGTHPDFSLGGHMIPNSQGYVPVDGTCFLMPICYWHNNPARDGVRFFHTETRMLKLTGYMEGETALTFAARFDSNRPFSFLLSVDDTWRLFDLFEEEIAAARQAGANGAFVLMERLSGPGGGCRIVDAH
jgi:hypothetical protein